MEIKATGLFYLNVIIICIGDQGVSSASDYIRKNEINHIRHMEVANVKIEKLKLMLVRHFLKRIQDHRMIKDSQAEILYFEKNPILIPLLDTRYVSVTHLC